jgi:hypothetical protein
MVRKRSVNRNTKSWIKQRSSLNKEPYLMREPSLTVGLLPRYGAEPKKATELKATELKTTELKATELKTTRQRDKTNGTDERGGMDGRTFWCGLSSRVGWGPGRMR